MIYLFLVEAALQLVPKELWGERSVQADAERRGRRPDQFLLDVSIHYDAMVKHGGVGKRGRPDILHLSLLTALDSPLNQMGYLKTYIHTLEDIVISIDPKTRLPRSYPRFEGLMVQLLREGHVPPKPPYFLEVLEEDLETLLERVEAKRKIVFSRSGRLTDPRRIFSKESIEEGVSLLIGAFQRGSISEEILSLADEVISISRFPLSTHLTVSRVLAEIEWLLEWGG